MIIIAMSCFITPSTAFNSQGFQRKIRHGNNQNEILKKEIIRLKKDMVEMKTLHEFITVREIFETLEQRMMIEITGSKRKASQYDNIFQMNHSVSNYGYDRYFEKYGLTNDHIVLIMTLKKFGNNVFIRSTIKLKEFESIIISILDDIIIDYANNQDIEYVKDILKLLKIYKLDQYVLYDYNFDEYYY
jgi:hypothetical protein